MIIEDRTSEKKLFGFLKIGDVFKYADNLYIKIDPIYAINPINADSEEIEDYIESYSPANAYDLSSHKYDTINENDEVQVVKATLVIG